MALALVYSRGQAGLEAYPVAVEVHIAGGLPGFSMVGLPTTSVRESRDRVRAALQACGLPIPARRVTVHLGPADVPKDGGRFDLPIALGVVHAEHKPQWDLSNCEFVGELSLAGELRHVTGMLPAVVAARDRGRAIVVPAANAEEAGLVSANTAHAATHIRQVLDWLDGHCELPKVAAVSPGQAQPSAMDMADVQGQALAKRAIVVAAAGGHNLLLFGPPGSGKSMLAERLPTLLPALSNDEYLTCAAIASLCNREPPRSAAPPFRAPHHTATAQALLGGGGRPRPGEVSLAHHGVLFLDELPEFRRDALEALREPLETGTVTISRAMHQMSFPAGFQLVAAMNPCPCGYRGNAELCGCTPAQLARYASRVSGPLLDRIDLHVEVPQRRPGTRAAAAPDESPELRERVAAARTRQLARAGTVNARLSPEQLRMTARMSREASMLLERSAERWHLSGRALTRIVKTARTVADLDPAVDIEARHVAEALQMRQLDRRIRAGATH